jgi:non-ribosomal peptide synthetase component E (peptide arylation enzyme)
MSFARLLDKAAGRYPTRVALIDGNHRRTYAGMNSESASLNLAAAEVRPGARVALHMKGALFGLPTRRRSPPLLPPSIRN